MICEENEHDTSNYPFNLRNKPNYQVYQAQSTNQNQQLERNFQQNNYNNNRRGGFWHGGHLNQGYRQSGPQRSKPRCYIRLKDDHLFQDCPWQDKIDLKFCGNCGVMGHSLEDCLVMLERITNKKNVDLPSCVSKNELKCIKNANIITRNGTNTNNIEISKAKDNNQEYPDVSLQNSIFKDATNVFEEISKSDVMVGNNNKSLNELLQLLTKEEAVAWLIDLLYEVRKSNTTGRIQKSICSLGKCDNLNLDLLVDLIVNVYNISQVVVEFG